MDAVWDGRSDGSRDKTGSWVWDQSTGGGHFVGECGAPYSSLWHSSPKVRRNCGLRWYVGSAEALVATQLVPQLRWAIIL